MWRVDVRATRPHVWYVVVVVVVCPSRTYKANRIFGKLTLFCVRVAIGSSRSDDRSAENAGDDALHDDDDDKDKFEHTVFSAQVDVINSRLYSFSFIQETTTTTAKTGAKSTTSTAKTGTKSTTTKRTTTTTKVDSTTADTTTLVATEATMTTAVTEPATTQTLPVESTSTMVHGACDYGLL